MACIPQDYKLRLSSRNELTHAYATLAQTVTGTIATHTLTASSTLATASLVIGSIIRVTASNHEYTVQNVSGTVITTVEALSQSYAGSSLKIDIVDQWNALDGYGNVATQATSTKRPAYVPGIVNGNDAVEFNASTKALTLATNTQTDNIFANGGTFLFIAGVDSDGGGTLGRIIEKTTSGGVAAWNIVTTTSAGGFYKILFNVVTSGTAGAWLTGSAVALTEPQIVSISYNSSTPTVPPVIRVQGYELPAITETSTPTGTVLNDAGGVYTIGNRIAADRGLDGRLMEVFAYKRVLSTWELGNIESYFANLYGYELYDNPVKYYGAREFTITKPSVVAAVPLLILLHGGGGSASTFIQQLQIGPVMGESAVLAFLTATKNNDGFRTWNSGGAQTFNNAPDSTYIANLVNHIATKVYPDYVDLDQVYLVGHSNGGMMSYRMAIEHPELFAGVFAMSADVMVTNPNTYTGRIMHYHGAEDTNVPLTGGVGSGGITYTPPLATVQLFTNANNGTGVVFSEDGLTGDFFILPSPAEHSVASLKTALTLAPYSTTLPDVIYNFIFP